MFTGKVIAAYVWWNPKHLVRKARPTRKMVTLRLIGWKFFSRKARRLEIGNHGMTFLSIFIYWENSHAFSVSALRRAITACCIS